jgi:hypothetical protein
VTFPGSSWRPRNLTFDTKFGEWIKLDFTVFDATLDSCLAIHHDRVSLQQLLLGPILVAMGKSLVIRNNVAPAAYMATITQSFCIAWSKINNHLGICPHAMTEILLHYKETSEKAAKLANDLLNNESLSELFHPEPTTARVVFVLWIPGHWTTVWIDQPSGVVNFVDSCPNTNRTKYAAQILIPIA